VKVRRGTLTRTCTIVTKFGSHTVVFSLQSFEFFNHLRRFRKLEDANGSDKEEEEQKENHYKELKDQENHYGLSLVTIAHSFTKLLTKNENDSIKVHCGVVDSLVELR
jgi:hypothetical protein